MDLAMKSNKFNETKEKNQKGYSVKLIYGTENVDDCIHSLLKKMAENQTLKK